MDKVIINDFVMKLGFNSKEADKGFDRIEKRVLKLNKKLERSQKTLTRGYKESVVDSNKKEQALQRIIGLKKRAQKIEKHQNKMSSREIALQTKLGRLEKISLDIESKKLRILICFTFNFFLKTSYAFITSSLKFYWEIEVIVTNKLWCEFKFQFNS